MANENIGLDVMPSFCVYAESIPEAFYYTFKILDNNGAERRTQYDRKKEDGEFIDPPGKTAAVQICIKNPRKEPRFPITSYSEIGKYIAEFLGAKDHLVVPREKLLKKIEDKSFEAKEWPYCYHQRLTKYPLADGKTLNQLELILDRLAKDPLTRRAIADTGVPEIDSRLEEDLPCLRSIQLMVGETRQGKPLLHMIACWRSRDLYKAWSDNLIGITNLQRALAQRLSEKMGREISEGLYTEFNGSLHIYGQDYLERGADKFLKNFPTLESFIKRAKTSEEIRDTLIVPQLIELKEQKDWNFPPESLDLIDNLIEDFTYRGILP